MTYKKSFAFSLLTLVTLTGCVTQSYENDNATPVVQSESSNNEIAMTRISLGLGYLKMGNTTQAKLNLEKAKRFSPNLVQVHTAFAHYYDTVGEPELAVQSFEKALSIKADDADALNNYGVFLCKSNKVDQAEQQFLKAIAVPSYLLVAQSYENLALCQLKSDNFEKAEQYLEKAIQHSPTRASALMNMMRVQYAKSEYKTAQAYLKRYEKSTRRFTPEALAIATKIYQKQRNRKIAQNYGAMLVKMFPASYEAKQYLLNELAEIEIDVLASRYQASLPKASKKNKKRIVKLSPKKTVDENTAQSITSVPKVKSREQKPLLNEAEKPVANVGEQTVNLPVHVVKSGDSLFSISKKYNIQMRAIEKWNNLTRSSVIKIGDVIYLANPKKLTKS